MARENEPQPRAVGDITDVFGRWEPCGGIYFTLRTKSGEHAIGSFSFLTAGQLRVMAEFMAAHPEYELLTMERLAAAIAKEMRHKPNPPAPASPAQVTRPVCPDHKLRMLPSKKHPGEHYCPYDNDEAGFCPVTFKEGKFQNVNREL